MRRRKRLHARRSKGKTPISQDHPPRLATLTRKRPVGPNFEMEGAVYEDKTCPMSLKTTPAGRFGGCVPAQWPSILA